MSQTNHEITLEQAVAMVSRYRKALPSMLQTAYTGSLPFAETFDKAVFEKLTSVTGCRSIRSYLGLDEKNQITMIFTAVDEKNNDILSDQGGSLFEFGDRCPPICGVGPLNPSTT